MLNNTRRRNRHPNARSMRGSYFGGSSMRDPWQRYVRMLDTLTPEGVQVLQATEVAMPKTLTYRSHRYKRVLVRDFYRRAKQYPYEAIFNGPIQVAFNSLMRAADLPDLGEVLFFGPQ